MGVFDYLDADLIAGYYSATDSLPARIALFRGDVIVRVESLQVCHLSAWQQLFLACGQGSLFPPVL